MTPLTAYLKELREVCEKATPGPWQINSDGIYVDHKQKGTIAQAIFRKDETFIATCNPATVLRLIAALEKAIGQRDWLGSEYDMYYFDGEQDRLNTELLKKLGVE